MHTRVLFPLILSLLLFPAIPAAASSGTATSSTSDNTSARQYPAHINTLYAGYDLYTLRPKAAATYSLNGVVIGYSIDFKLPGKHPVYIGTGIDARFTLRDKTFHDSPTYNEINARIHTRLFNLNIPLNLSYRIPASNLFSVIPQFGFNLRVQLYGKAKTEIPGRNNETAPSHEAIGFTPGDVNLFSKRALGDRAFRRVQAGWHASLKLQYDRFVLGVSYGTDFAKIRNELGSSNLLVNLGYVF